MASLPGSELPADIALVHDFVNTLDVEKLLDEVPSPDSLAGWFRARGLLAPGDLVSPEAFTAAIQVREALRAVLLAHNGEPLPAAELRTLERVSAACPLTVGFDAEGVATLRAAAQGGWKALGGVFAAVVSAQRDGRWERLKVCPAGDCQCAFYDTSKNRSGRWCSMRVCGNRMKLQRFRAGAARQPR
ncbi:CGNR zinc finger domain-containing protein [Pyxidicoccus xibeiensis]|uniref:CGNR zinc finger domain-containing protein n=1 Tax=Pyxidicoccus xibeiensis TaxID=2906759 RepID=UPI0020A7A507|nr:CGNR zinc finger domain-containing protein [Pyxidicoccus xibeiensis]MCP3143467.1 CGNR zinc finger domain-containing protein [Pyxidicoccus xibeiensis]